MKLNLGCGTNKLDGYVNVDRAHGPDVIWDLEVFPWPWPDSYIEEIRAHHVLEHLGSTPEVFIGVVKEMYRVCEDGAKVDIVVPHPRHDDFLNDPTHVRPITAATMSKFSAELNRKWEREGWSDSKLGLEHGVDFYLVSTSYYLDPHVERVRASHQLPERDLQQMARELNNIVKSIHMVLECVKP